jgi:hypothetical protein
MKKDLKVSNKSELVKTLGQQTAFGKYKTLGTNRQVAQPQVKKLVKSFSEFGTASAQVTVIRTKAFNDKVEYFIADGQHSIEAAKEIGLPLNVTIIKLTDDTPLNVTKYIATLNSNNKAWSPNDFLEAYATNGIKEYKLMADVRNKYSLTISDLIDIFGNGQGATKIFKEGTLKFKDEAKSLELLDQAVRVKNIIPNKAFIRRALYKVLRASKDYKRMTDAIIEAAKGMQIAQVKFSENEAEFTEHLTKIYCAEFKKRKLPKLAKK